MEPPPSTIPAVEWKGEEAIRHSPTVSFGKINFINVEHIGGTKPAKVRNSPRQVLSTAVRGW
jgi:hypothetical protein